MSNQIKLLHGDCLELMKEIPDGYIDFILTDPPYGTTACKWDSVIPFEPMWLELKRIIKPNGAIALFGLEPFSSALRMSNIKNYKYDWVMQKERKTRHLQAKKMPMLAHENIIVFYTKQPFYDFDSGVKNPFGGKKTPPTSTENYHKILNQDAYLRPENKVKDSLLPVFNMGVDRGLHPTQKPVALLEYLIKTYTLEGETVLDFTMGSGSTGVACINTGRNFIGIEKDEQYFEIARKRIDSAKQADS